MKKNVEKQKEIKDLLEAVRRAAYAEGYAAAKMEQAINEEEATQEPPLPPVYSEVSDNAGEFYVSKTPIATTTQLTREYFKSIRRPAGPTEVIRNTFAAKGIKLSHTTVRRAIEALVERRELREVDTHRWIYIGK